MNKYRIVINWSHEDSVFIAEAPELPGCMAHGNSQQAALAEIDQAIALWIETAREFGDPVPEPIGYAPAGD
ncbi:MAG: type II toxin-antitoxin system HicB family antitoxin [Chloroflexi bacterium]|nr:type II toxin-antitoxin system HicB family antitoxin [Chloroflexota bacterium]